MELFSAVRSDERRATFSAMGLLFGFMAAHAMLETARDALFLAEKSATKLPWVYLLIALGALLLTRLHERTSSSGRSHSLAPWLLGASVVTLGFWCLVFNGAGWIYYALYVWSGVVATLILLRFWLMMGQQFTATTAKRVYAVIGTGSVLGAIAGSAVAAVVTLLVGAHALILVSAAVMAATAILPRFLRDDHRARDGGRTGIFEGILEWAIGHRQSTGAQGRSLGESFALVMSRSYVRRVALLVLVSTATLTLSDYVFKSAIDAHVSAEHMGTVLAGVYLGLNILSLLAQLFLVGWFLRVLSVTSALAVLPLFLLGGAIGLAVLGGLGAAIAIRGADGALRHSLHRTTSELLYVPMTSSIRSVAKGLIDVVGQRGGQAVASLAILGLVALGAEERLLGVVLASLALLWVCMATELRRHYLNLFRGSLERGIIRTQIAFPEFDVSSLESLMAALNSDNDSEVLAALDILAEQDKINMVQVFILFHPSAEVATRAASYFADAGRTDFAPIARRRYRRSAPEVRAKLLLALSRVDPGDEELAEAALSQERIVQTVAVVVQVARRTISHEKALEPLNSLRSCDCADSLVMCALALSHHRAPELTELLISLSEHEEVAVRIAAADAMAAQPDVRYLPSLLRLLPTHQTRETARKALVAIGPQALDAIEEALGESSTPLTIRRHLPRTIIRFEPMRSSRILLEHVLVEKDGVVRFKILRGLTQLRMADPRLKLDLAQLERGTKLTLARAFELLEKRLTLQRGAEKHPERSTPVHGLLLKLLHDKEAHTVDRLMKLLSLQYSARELNSICRGLGSVESETRSSSRELLENLLPRPIREPVMALVDDAPDAERLERAGQFHQATSQPYDEVLKSLLNDYSESIRSLVVYHVGELDLYDLRPELASLELPKDSVLTGVIRRTLERLSPSPTGEVSA